mgnify:FL=1
MDATTWFVGELNPYGARPEMALYPLPENSAGYRLCEKVLGIRRADYLDPDKFHRQNLCAGQWDKKLAARRAGDIIVEADAHATRLNAMVVIVMLGAKVAEAFGSKVEEFRMEVRGPLLLIRLPHPSGRCRSWNDPQAYQRAREVLALNSTAFGRLVVEGAMRHGEQDAKRFEAHMEKHPMLDGSVYINRKNGKPYRVLKSDATNTETEEAVVVYEGLDGKVWVRPKKLFLEKFFIWREFDHTNGAAQTIQGDSNGP